MKDTGIQRAESLAIVRFRVWAVHIASILVLFTPVTSELITIAIVGFFVRVFAWEAGSHRYFSHRSFKTSRTFQFLLAVMAAAAGQRGPLWWAAHHRMHHRHADLPMDPHSPIQRGFWYAHIGWVLDQKTLSTDLDAVRDFARFQELVWINKYHYIFPYLLLVAVFLLGQYTDLFGHSDMGISAAAWGFFLPTLLSLHATFVVNTLTHTRSSGWTNTRRYSTNDTSSNSWLLCIPTMGASWHNNHHRYMNSARAGFFWWEIDLAYYLLKVLSLLGIVWDLHQVPLKILKEGKSQETVTNAEYVEKN